MRYWRHTVFALLVACCVTQPAFGQIETQAETYDLTLEDCLTQVLTRNPEIQESRLDVERAAGSKLVYRSRALPQLATQVSAGLRFGNLFPPSGPYSIVTAEFSQPLLDAGIPPTLRRGRLEVILAQQSLNRIVTDRLHEGRLTFLRALYLRDLVTLHEEIDQRLRANVQSEQQRLDAGTGNQAAVKSAKIQQLNLELQLANLRGYYFSTVTRIGELCGRNPTEATNGTRGLRLPKPVGSLHYEPAKVNWPEESAYALQHRADVKLLEALVDAIAADKQTVQAGYYPLVSLTASGLFIPSNYLVSKQTSIVPGQDPRSSEVQAGVQMSWQIIDNGRVTGEARQLEASRQAYEISLHQLEQSIPRELAVIEGALQSADARRDALVKSAEEAEENLRLIETRVSLGEATQFDFLQAQGNLLSVRAGIADATYSHEVERAELDHATGRYLQYGAQGAR
jgi:outer membrane protein TolC